MRIGFYPGCSMHGTAREYGESLAAICEALGVRLQEVPDWACCGASSAHATNHLLGVALPARTLALAEARKMDQVMAPCAACYGRLAAARHELARDAELQARVRRILERRFENQVEVINVVGFLQQLLPKIESRIEKPLKDLGVVCYYGCLLLRPHQVTGFDDPEAPSSMEQVVKALGAEPLEWNRRADCCGAGFSLSRTGSVIRMGREILDDARRAGAEVIVVACPMCHANLDMRQAAMNRGQAGADELPVLYITELVGLALGLNPKRLGLGRHYVSTSKLLGRLEKQVAPGQEVR